MKNLIKKILKENNEENKLKFINYVLSRLKPPYFKNLKNFGTEKNEINLILSLVFGEPIKIKDNVIFNEKDEEIYYEYYDGDWRKSEYDENGNQIYTENSDGFWQKNTYDEKGNKIYYEDSDGNWEKREYDERGNEIYLENSSGYWKKYKYNKNDHLIYFETSKRGIVLDKR